jgi:hypothetical protein
VETGCASRLGDVGCSASPSLDTGTELVRLAPIVAILSCSTLNRSVPFAAGLLLVAFLLLSGCSQTLLTKPDYRPSLVALADGHPDEARKVFPKGEDKTFITTEEKTYLDLLQGRADLAALSKYRDLADTRIRFVVSREVSDFFYVGTPEGYYASEHEIIWMHLLLSWGYSQQGQYEKACVEARSANFLLEAPWSPNGHFDDPTLRAILGVMWSLCGSWDDAQVTFRAAANLDPSLTWARELADMDRPPRNLIAVFGGIGPEPYWDPEAELNPLRGARHLGFKPQGLRSSLFAAIGEPHLELHLTPGSAPWYQRHLVRDNEIHDLIGDTHYALGTSAEAGLHAAKTSLGVVVWVASTVAGFAGSYVIAELCTISCSGDAVLAIIGFPIVGFEYGHKKYNEIESASAARLAYQTDPSNFYHFVRFLPEYAWIGWSEAALGDNIDLASSDLGTSPAVGAAHLAASGSLPHVYLGFLPDSPEPGSEAAPQPTPRPPPPVSNGGR